MDHYQTIANNFQATVETIMASVDELAVPLERASAIMTHALLADRKIVVCGLGPDSALAQLLACNLLGHSEDERPALPAITLGNITTGSAEGAAEGLLSRPVSALGQDGDILFCIHSSNAGASLLRAVHAGHQRNMTVVALSNAACMALTSLLSHDDVGIQVAAARRSQVIELQTMAINTLCQLIDHDLFGAYTQD
jgi:D-sedoheptulose 7-phosphate isomerase